MYLHKNAVIPIFGFKTAFRIKSHNTAGNCFLLPNKNTWKCTFSSHSDSNCHETPEDHFSWRGKTFLPSQLIAKICNGEFEGEYKIFWGIARAIICYLIWAERQSYGVSDIPIFEDTFEENASESARRNLLQMEVICFLRWGKSANLTEKTFSGYSLREFMSRRWKCTLDVKLWNDYYFDGYV